MMKTYISKNINLTVVPLDSSSSIEEIANEMYELSIAKHDCVLGLIEKLPDYKLKETADLLKKNIRESSFYNEGAEEVAKILLAEAAFRKSIKSLKRTIENKKVKL